MTLKEFLLKHRPTVLFIVFSILNIIFLTSGLTSYLRTVRSFFIYFFSFGYIPANKVVNYPVEVYNRFLKLIYITEENRKLLQQVKKLLLYKLKYEQLYQTYSRLMEITNVKNILPEFSLIDCKILVREYFHWYNYLVILGGKQDGIEEDLPVVVVANKKLFLIGRIWTVSEKTSKVLLITDPLSGIPVKVKDKPIQGIVLGEATPYLVMEYILPEDDIKIGDVIVTSGLINNIPENIEIGTVTNITASSTTGFKKAIVKLNYNINNLDYVSVLKKYNQR